MSSQVRPKTEKRYGQQIKRSSTTLVMREIQSKATIGMITHSTEWQDQKARQNKLLARMWNQESLSHIHGGANWYKHFESNLAATSHAEHWPAQSPAMALLDGWAGHLHACGQQETYSSVCNSKRLEASQVPINCRPDYTTNSENERTLTMYTPQVSLRIRAECKKEVVKTHIV